MKKRNLALEGFLRDRTLFARAESRIDIIEMAMCIPGNPMISELAKEREALLQALLIAKSKRKTS